MHDTVSESMYDGMSMYCRLLGHEVPFSYCRKPGSETFCRKLPDCWAEIIDIKSFIDSHYTEDQIRDALTPPQTKVASLIDLIKKAREGS